MSISKDVIKSVMLDNQKDVERYELTPRNVDLADFPLQVFVGVRRCGKSFLLFQMMKQLLADGHKWSDMLYLDFEDSRLNGLDAQDLNNIIPCHAELYENAHPILFLDEIQNVDGWEKYARNLADRKYQVYITGSNAKMLSKGIMQELGGRYLPHEVYPYNLREYLNFLGVSCDEKALLQTETQTAFMRAYREYFTWGGLPEAVGMNVKRNYLTSLYQKIYLGDIASRHNISNTKLLQLMLKKIAESTMHPLSYSRIAKILSSVGGKITIPTVSNYISYAEEAWMLLRIRNITSAFADRESNCKYYFIDNGLLSLQLIDADTKLLENMVAIELFRHYGHDEDNERIYFYNDNIEVDFYVPEDGLAIQVSYTIKNDETYEREVSALSKLTKVYPCKRRMIITYDEEATLTDEYGVIEVVPCWKWMLQQA